MLLLRSLFQYWFCIFCMRVIFFSLEGFRAFSLPWVLWNCIVRSFVAFPPLLVLEWMLSSGNYVLQFWAFFLNYFFDMFLSLFSLVSSYGAPIYQKLFPAYWSSNFLVILSHFLSLWILDVGNFNFSLLSPILHLKFVATILMSRSFFLFSVLVLWRQYLTSPYGYYW